MLDFTTLVFVAAKKWVTAVDGRTGEPVWRTEVPGSKWFNSGFMMLTADPTGVYVCRTGTVSCLDPLTGQVLWVFRPKDAGTSLPIVATMMGGSNDGGQAALVAALQAQQQAAAAAASG